jgi:hypothetical protein
MRWTSQLATFDFQVKFRSGKSICNADALSRRPVPKSRIVTDATIQNIVCRIPVMDVFDGSLILTSVQISSVHAELTTIYI